MDAGEILLCDRYLISESLYKQEEITPAEKANGATEKWCARLEYIYKKPGEEKWQDADNMWNGLSYQDKEQGKILLKTNEVWGAQPGGFCKCAKKITAFDNAKPLDLPGMTLVNCRKAYFAEYALLIHSRNKKQSDISDTFEKSLKSGIP